MTYIIKWYTSFDFLAKKIALVEKENDRRVNKPSCVANVVKKLNCLEKAIAMSTFEKSEIVAGQGSNKENRSDILEKSIVSIIVIIIIFFLKKKQKMYLKAISLNCCGRGLSDSPLSKRRTFHSSRSSTKTNRQSITRHFVFF